MARNGPGRGPPDQPERLVARFDEEQRGKALADVARSDRKRDDQRTDRSKYMGLIHISHIFT